MSAEKQSEVLRDLQKAHGKILNVIRYLIPKGGLKIAYCTDDAYDEKEVAVASDVSVGFGYDEPIVRVLLTVRRYDENIRSAVCIKCNEDIYETVKEAFIDVERYDVNKYPKGISTMDWGVSFICRKGVPIAIAAENDAIAGDCIYILGSDPFETSTRTLIISERLTYTNI